MTIISLSQLVKFAAALLFVLGLMGGLTLILRRFGNLQNIAPPDKRRLKLVESLPLDARRRLVLVQCDDRQHLLILGATGETVIETNVESGQDGRNDPA